MTTHGFIFLSISSTAFLSAMAARSAIASAMLPAAAATTAGNNKVMAAASSRSGATSSAWLSLSKPLPLFLFGSSFSIFLFFAGAAAQRPLLRGPSSGPWREGR